MADSVTEGGESGGTSGLALRIGAHIISIVWRAKLPQCTLVFRVLFGALAKKKRSPCLGFTVRIQEKPAFNTNTKHKHGNIFHLPNNNSVRTAAASHEQNAEY